MLNLVSQIFIIVEICVFTKKSVIEAIDLPSDADQEYIYLVESTTASFVRYIHLDKVIIHLINHFQ